MSGETTLSVSTSDKQEITTEEEINFSLWAILGGAIVGVAAVAVAPFTGGGSVLGAATLLGSLAGTTAISTAAAGVGAVAGGVASGVSQNSKEKEKNKFIKAGHIAGLAEASIIIQELEEQLTKAAEHYMEQNKSNEFVICLFAVGAAIAACDGEFHGDEEVHLREFVMGASTQAAPPSLQEAFQRLLTTPPTFDGAMLYVEKLDQAVWPVIDNILTVVSEADGRLSQEELTFIGQWNKFKANALQSS
ncbi:hypothetical protein L6172_01125 [Thalassospiraceae bacterium SW-3-3]|nr:hypothetical protein L6172_01125 [Thalassospiraceae bacterium SW-3-3]